MAWGTDAYNKAGLNAGAKGQGDFSAFGMGGESGALGKYDYLGQGLDKSNPWLQSDRKSKDAKAKSEAAAQELYGKTQGLNDKLNEADDSYLSTFNGKSSAYLSGAEVLVNDYLKSINGLKSQAEGQANDAKQTYTNSILPGYKDAMAKAKVNSDSAMTLAQAGDPNNPVMKAVRDLYDKQAEAARKTGQQDYGTLSALGAQAAQGQFGAAGPMTSGQMGQIYAQNQNQAGDAYAKAQQRMYDLQQQGLDKGFDQSNQMYQFGQQAQGHYSDTIKDLQGGEDDYYGLQGRFRDELGGYAGDSLGVQSGLNSDKFNMGMMGADINKGNAYAGTGREQQSLNQLYGSNQQILNNDLQASLANNASKGQFMSSIAGLFAGGMGGAAGGAAAGQIRRKQPNGQSGYAE